MRKISNKIFCKEFLFNIGIDNKILPNPYFDYPFLIIKNFLPKTTCTEILEFVKSNNDAEEAKVKVMLLNSIAIADLNQTIRKTKIHELNQDLKDIYDASFKDHQKSIEEYFNICLTLSTDIQVLEYSKGSFYIQHSDDSSQIIDNLGNTVGFTLVAPQRKITTVLFASTSEENFCGGELLFNYLYDENKNLISYKPIAGDMIVFPSNPFFSHEVKEVISGTRLTLVQWHNGIVN